MKQTGGKHEPGAITCQLFVPDASGYPERRSRTISYQAGPEEHLEFTGLQLLAGQTRGRLRLDPSAVAGIVHLKRLVIRNASGEAVHSFGPDSWPEEVKVAGTAWRIPGTDGLDLYCYGEDPQILLPPFPDLAGKVFTLKVTLAYATLEDGEKFRLHNALTQLRETEARLNAATEGLEALQQKHKAELAVLQQEHKERRLGAGHCYKQSWEHTFALHKAMKSETRRVEKKLRDAGRKSKPEERRPLHELRKLLPLGKDQVKEAAELVASGLFDDAWYVQCYPDVAASGMDPLVHFMTHGAREKRNPNPHFWTAWYLQEHPDVAATGMNPLLHYVRSGWREGRNPNPHFDSLSYLQGNEEARLSATNPLLHFLIHDAGLGLPSGTGAVPAREDWDLVQPAPAPVGWRERLGRIKAAEQLTISVVMPVCRNLLPLLERAVQSVFAQEYALWELCILDDGSNDPMLRERLENWAAGDPRIKVLVNRTSHGMSAATNDAMALSTGEFVALLSGNDVLAPDALGETMALLAEHPDTDVTYSDVDQIDETGRCHLPFHKPAWSPVFFLGVMYVGSLLVARRSVLLQAGGCHADFDKVRDFELMLRLSEATSRIRHIPKILYHQGTTGETPAASGIQELQVAAVTAYLKRRNIATAAASHPRHAKRLVLAPVEGGHQPLVSIIIPTTADSPLLAECLRSIVELTTYAHYEILLLVRAGSVKTGTQIENLAMARSLAGVRVLEYDFPFNYSRVNNLGAREVKGELLVLLNDDTRIITPAWLEVMATHLHLPGVGAVGPKLLYPNGTVQHAGVVLGFRGTADHVMRGFPGDSDGYHGSLSASREVSAVTAACLMTRAETYRILGGMTECYSCIYQDVDFCLRVRQLGLSVVYAANAELVHHESSTRGPGYDCVDREIFIDRWREKLVSDPCYNINFTRNRHDYSLKPQPA